MSVRWYSMNLIFGSSLFVTTNSYMSTDLLDNVTGIFVNNDFTSNLLVTPAQNPYSVNPPDNIFDIAGNKPSQGGFIFTNPVWDIIGSMYVIYLNPIGNIVTLMYPDGNITGYSKAALTSGNFIYLGFDPSCFNFGTKILTLNKNLADQYVAVENLHKGDMVKTYLHGYRKILKVGCGKFINNPDDFRRCMYKMKKNSKNSLTEDLVVTGGHGILVNKLNKTQELKQAEQKFKHIIDNKYLLLASLHEEFERVEERIPFTYYHFICENDGDKNKRYGVWANGLLTETPSENQFDYEKFQKIEK